MARPPSAEELKLVARIRQDALVGMHLHQTRIGKLASRTLLTDWLALAVPILYIPVRLITKGDSSFQAVEILWEILAAVLLVVAASRITLHWDRDLEEHRRFRDDDLRLASEAAAILDGVPQQGLPRLFALDTQYKRQDLDSLDVTTHERQYAYRQALQEFYSSGKIAECPNCHVSPETFTPGKALTPESCEFCGNTPID